MREIISLIGLGVVLFVLFIFILAVAYQILDDILDDRKWRQKRKEIRKQK